MSDDMSENGCQYEERVGLTGSDIFFCENERNVDLSESSVEKLIIVHSYVASCAWKCQHHYLHDLHWFAAACSSLYNNNR